MLPLPSGAEQIQMLSLSTAMHSCADVLGENDFNSSVRIRRTRQNDSQGRLYVFICDQQAQTTTIANRW